MLIPRPTDLAQVREYLSIFPIVALLGPRQCGKTTLARQLDCDHYFDLENPRDLARLEQPQLTLERLEGTIVIDEIQRSAGLFPLLRYLVDHRPRQRYLILGSASRDLIQHSSETLAGRIGFVRLGGFRLTDVPNIGQERLHLRGGLPRSLLPQSDRKSFIWRENYITTFLERDIPALGIRIPSPTLRRFWIMLSHYHGQTLNYRQLGRSFGLSDVAIRRHVEVLVSTLMVRLLMPWHTNIGKRLVRSPKIYLRDSGLFHTLQGIETWEQLESNPKLGASWEGFALEQVIMMLGLAEERLFFWATHAGAEVDLFWEEGGHRYAVEFKFADAPRMTRSMHSALDSLELTKLWVVYPGSESYALSERAMVAPLQQMAAQGRRALT